MSNRPPVPGAHAFSPQDANSLHAPRQHTPEQSQTDLTAQHKAAVTSGCSVHHHTHHTHAHTQHAGRPAAGCGSVAGLLLTQASNHQAFVISSPESPRPVGWAGHQGRKDLASSTPTQTAHNLPSQRHTNKRHACSTNTPARKRKRKTLSPPDEKRLKAQKL